MSRISTSLAFLRFTRGLRGAFQDRLTLDEAKAAMRESLTDREDRFLAFVEKHVYGNPRSPYLPMLRIAACELGDLRNMVRDKGLEPTLLELRKADVYVSFEEFKGRQPIVRQGRVLEVKPDDFLNPWIDAYLETTSSGSTGRASKSRMSADGAVSVRSGVGNMILAYVHGFLGQPKAIWNPVLPTGEGLGQILRGVWSDQVPVRWFSPGSTSDLNTSLLYRFFTFSLVLFLRRQGVPAPWPEWVPVERGIKVAEWAVRTVKEHGGCVINTFPSLALRVSLAAQEHGLDLTGLTLMGAGEPTTDAKWRGITRSGARWVPYYSCTEAGNIGMGCANPQDGNDVHWMKGQVGMIQYPRQLPGSDLIVNSFYYTTLQRTPIKLLLNMESDDFGVVEECHCGCRYEELGLTQHIRHIRSFAKLTAEGMTVAGTAMVRILEDVLPARFGGTALDYQLQEAEDEQGFTRYYVVVHPRVTLDDEQAVLEAVWEGLRKTGPGENISQSMWQRAQTFRIKRAEPTWGPSGKFHPLVRNMVIETAIRQRKEL
jgi:hypothetical protein